ncbi:hypothetical protein [Pseudothermotoga sp.]|uniref:hypothetical protein n=1 Tax=Pseudothermotoga sp. TaxID=2033661 RepID=UPI0031F5F7C3
MKKFLPALIEYTFYGISASLDVKPKTVELLMRKGIYAMIMRGDILEIVNFEDLK